MWRAAFSAAECDAIAAAFVDRVPVERDTRAIPNLPRSPEAYGVSRINRFDDGALQASGALDWVYERIASRMSPAQRSAVLGLAEGETGGECGSAGGAAGGAARLSALVEFNLLHEFDVAHSRFDWHVDTKVEPITRKSISCPALFSTLCPVSLCPADRFRTDRTLTPAASQPNDGTLRTFNLNVMLSERSDYKGGELQARRFLPRRSPLAAHAAAAWPPRRFTPDEHPHHLCAPRGLARS